MATKADDKNKPKGGTGTNQYGIKGVPKENLKPPHPKYKRPEELSNGLQYIARDPDEYERELAERSVLQHMFGDNREVAEIARKAIVGLGFFLFAKLILILIGDERGD